MLAHGLHWFRVYTPLRLGSALVVLGTFLWLLLHPTVLAAQSPPLSSHNAPLPAALPPDSWNTIMAQLETTLTALRGQAPPLAAAEMAEILTHGGSPVLLLPPRLPQHPVSLATLRQRLQAQFIQVRQQMEATAQHLRQHHLPEVLHQRHQEAVAKIDTAMTTFQQHLDAIASAPDTARRAMAAAQALAHLQAHTPQRARQKVDPQHLPFRVPDSKVRPPRERAEEFHSALEHPQPVLLASTELLPGLLAPGITATALPTPEDLTETEDLQFTEDIRVLAAELEHQPVKIYNWVHDHIEFMPTYGSIQGAHMTLQTRRGNAFDTASLLIALLRVSDIPARYVTGTVQIPIAQVMNWVGGVEVPEAALNLLGQGGIPSIALVQGGEVVAVKLEQVWVEAWVDFEPSRGAVHREGDTWVPLDASFKQYTYTPGMDLRAQVPFDAETLLTQLTTTVQINDLEGWVSGLDHVLIERSLMVYQTQSTSFVSSQNSRATVSDVVGTKTIAPTNRAILAAGLSYPLVVRGMTWRQIPDTLRHKFRFALYATALDQLSDIPVVSLLQNLPALVGKKITLSFSPASQADAQFMANYLPHPPADGSPLEPQAFPSLLPGYLIRLTAELRVDGVTVAHGGIFSMGQILVSTAGLYDPQDGWQDTENPPPVVGEYQTFALNAAGVAASQPQTLVETLLETKGRLETQQGIGATAEAPVSDMLASTIIGYFVAADVVARLSAGIAGVIEYRSPSFGSFRAKVQPHLVFGIPQAVSFPGLELDIARLSSIVGSKANDHVTQVTYVLANGLRQSALEHHIPTRLFNTAQRPGEAVSAVKALAIANKQGQRLYTLTPTNFASALSQLILAPDIQEELQTAIVAGKHAIVSQGPVTVENWTGVGYIIVDPETGAGAYQISGGANGAVYFFIGATAGIILWYGILSILATFPVAGVFLVPVISLLIGELAILLAGFILLYKLTENPDDRGCFWSGVASTLIAAGGPSLAVSTTYAYTVWGVAAAIFAPINVTFPTNCLFGASSLL